MTSSKDSKYPTRADAAKAPAYTESDRLSEEEQAERSRKFNAAMLFGDGYFTL